MRRTEFFRRGLLAGLTGHCLFERNSQHWMREAIELRTNIFLSYCAYLRTVYGSRKQF